MKRALIAVLVCGCVGFAATREAGLRRMGAARLASCVSNNECVFVAQCFRESEAWCRDAGMEKECGNGEVEGSCGNGIKRSALGAGDGGR